MIEREQVIRAVTAGAARADAREVMVTPTPKPRPNVAWSVVLEARVGAFMGMTAGCAFTEAATARDMEDWAYDAVLERTAAMRQAPGGVC